MMDKSCSSSMMNYTRAVTYSCTAEEESGWTAYFEDFSNNNNNRDIDDDQHHQEQSFCSSFDCTSSLVSDAASAAAWHKASHNNNNNHNHVGGSAPNVPKKLSFKKTRTKRICGDDLEDTASSPVNSPKIGDLRPVDHLHPRKIDDHDHDNSLGKEGNFTELQQQADNQKTDCCGKNDDSTDLKKRGLCLVPLSVLVNYLV